MENLTVEGSLSESADERDVLIEKLKSEIAKRDQFLARFMHDLRNPLTSAKMTAQLLIRKATGDEKTRAQLETIVKSVCRADEMIQGLLDSNSPQRNQ